MEIMLLQAVLVSLVAQRCRNKTMIYRLGQENPEDGVLWSVESGDKEGAIVLGVKYKSDEEPEYFEVRPSSLGSLGFFGSLVNIYTDKPRAKLVIS